MHVIQTIASIGEWVGGPSRSVTNLCSAIANHGCTVDLVAGYDPRRDGSLVVPVSKQVQLHLVKAKQILGVRICTRFGKSVKDQAISYTQTQVPVLVHDHGIWSLTNIAAASVAQRLGVPYVLHARGMLEPWALQYRGSKKKLAWTLYQKRIIESSAAIITTSEYELENVKKLFPRLPVAVIPNGVHFPEKELGCAGRKKLGRLNVLFMSRIHPVKNLLGLVRAWQLVCKVLPESNCVLQIAGPDELGHLRDIKALVHSLGLDSRVEFMGAVNESDKCKVFADADLFILPSFSENFGLVAAEALTYGLPVIATKGTPWGNLVENNCGWWVDPSPGLLADALIKALSLTNAERCEIGMRGRKFAESSFSWDGVGLSTIRLYEWVLGVTSSVPSFLHI